MTTTPDGDDRVHSSDAEPLTDAPEVYTASDEWWQSPYPSDRDHAPAVTMPRPLYAPGNPSAKAPSPPGPDVQAIRRAVSRLGRWPWSDVSSQEFTKQLAVGAPGGNVGDSGVAGVQRQEGIQPTGQLGEATFEAIRVAIIPEGIPNAGSFAFDATCLRLLDEASTRSDVYYVQEAIADYCARALEQAGKIHYAQVRPIDCYGVSPEAGFTTDCSGFANCALYWARQETGVKVPDPSGNGWNGWGYTQSQYETNKGRGVNLNGPFQIGDFALYGPSKSQTSHVTICSQDGPRSSARFTSHGSEGAPYLEPVDYRSDLVAVVRPLLVPA